MLVTEGVLVRHAATCNSALNSLADGGGSPMRREWVRVEGGGSTNQSFATQDPCTRHKPRVQVLASRVRHAVVHSVLLVISPVPGGHHRRPLGQVCELLSLKRRCEQVRSMAVDIKVPSTALCVLDS